VAARDDDAWALVCEDDCSFDADAGAGLDGAWPHVPEDAAGGRVGSLGARRCGPVQKRAVFTQMRFLGARRGERVQKRAAHTQGIAYLGFSDRGAREAVAGSGGRVFAPTYGFATHCYALKPAAARRLLAALPVAGPVDARAGAGSSPRRASRRGPVRP
jgi:GR25 family glycosyltransferase involved in LPS biosynthesis